MITKQKRSEYQRRWRNKHINSARAYERSSGKKRRENNDYVKASKAQQKEIYHRKRTTFLSMYGGKCDCCGETQQAFLTIEHMLGQKGKKRETSYRAYSNAIKEYRPDL